MKRLRSRRRRDRNAQRTTRLFVERLENRLLLTTFTVNNTGDESDANIGDSVCDVSDDNSGICTMRAAIEEANVDPTKDTIILTDVVSTGLGFADITTPVVIDGQGQGTIVAGGLFGIGAGVGLRLDPGSDGSEIRGLSIIDFLPFGTAIEINSTSNLIEDNVLSSSFAGLAISGSNNRVFSNFIGTNRGGTVESENVFGILISSEDQAASDNRIGAAGKGNVISGNDGPAIQIVGTASRLLNGTIIQANKIGTDLNGTTAIANNGGIVTDEFTTNTLIGGPNTEDGNVISGNTLGGAISLGGTSTIQNNIIGAGADRTTAIPNGCFGVQVGVNSIVGGPNAGNIIAYNNGGGIRVIGKDNRILNNQIHSSTASTSCPEDLGVKDATGHGIVVETVDGATIRENDITANAGKGIEDTNKSGFETSFDWLWDPDVAERVGVFRGGASREYTIDLFSNFGGCDPSGYGEGETFLEAVDVATDGMGRSEPFAVPLAPHVTATATDKLTKVTTEFSSCVGPDRMEIVQVVQDIFNSVPMVADKHTVVRVFPHGDDGADTTARLHGFKNGQALPGSPLSPQNVSTKAETDHNRNEEFASLNFILPEEWDDAGTIVLRAEVFPTSDSSHKRILQESVPFHERKRLRVSYVVTCVEALTSSTITCPGSDLSSRDFFMKKVFPLANDGLTYQQVNRPPHRFVGAVYATDLADLAIDWSFGYFGRADFDFLVGWVPGDATFQILPIFPVNIDLTGYAEGSTALVKDDVDAVFNLAHEVGHLLSLNHTNTDDSGGAINPLTDWPFNSSRIQNPGVEFRISSGKLTLDIVRADIEEDKRPYFDLMAYRDRNWISVFHYKKLFDALAPGPPASSGNSSNFNPAGEHGGTHDYMLIRGTVHRDTQATNIVSTYRIASPVSEPPTASDPNGDYCLEFHNGVGKLAEHCFDIAFDIQDVSFDDAPFVIAASFPAGTTRVDLIHDDAELASLIASPNAPVVSITSPQADDELQGNKTIVWTASDADNDPLLYAGEYSSDGGATWLPMAVDLTDTPLTFNTSEITGGDQVFFRVSASDGFHTASDEVGPVTVLPDAGAPWQNPAEPKDVDQDGFIAPLDVLVIINELNKPQFSVSGVLGERTDPTDSFFDVDGDGFVAPVDALRIINCLNEGITAEGESFVDPLAITALLANTTATSQFGAVPKDKASSGCADLDGSVCLPATARHALAEDPRVARHSTTHDDRDDGFEELLAHLARDIGVLWSSLSS
jgi:hypothetical protein